MAPGAPERSGSRGHLLRHFGGLNTSLGLSHTAEQRPTGPLRRGTRVRPSTPSCPLGGPGQPASANPVSTPPRAAPFSAFPTRPRPHRKPARQLLSESSPQRDRLLVLRTARLGAQSALPQQEALPPLPVSRGPARSLGCQWGPAGRHTGIKGWDPCTSCPSGTDKEVVDVPAHGEAAPSGAGRWEGALHSPGRGAQHSHDLIKDILSHDVTVGEQHLVHLASRGLPDLRGTERVTRGERPIRTQAE